MGAGWESDDLVIDRAGYRSHGSWGAQSDVYIMFFDGEAYDKFRLSKEEQALLDEEKQDQKSDTDKGKDKDAKKDKDKDKDKNKDKRKSQLSNRSNSTWQTAKTVSCD